MKNLRSFLLTTTCFLAAAGVASAQTQRDWAQPTAGTYDWFNTASWVGGTIPDTTGEYANFAAGGANAINRAANITVNVSSNLTVGRITSGTTASSTPDFGIVTITGSQITLDATGGTGVDALGRLERANSSLATSPGLVVNNNILLDDPDGGRFLANGSFVVNGNISGSVLLRKDGAHPVFLGGSNSHSGTVQLNNADLRATSTNGLRFTGNLDMSTTNTTGNNLSIQALGSGTTVASFAQVILPTNANSVFAFRVSGTGNMLDVTGQIVDVPLSSTGSVKELTLGNASGDTTYGITAPSGTGTVKFSGTDFTVNRNVNLGGNNNEVEFAPASGIQTWNGNLTNGNVNRTVTKSGAGTVVFAGDNNYGGQTRVTAGTLLLNGTNAPNTGGTGYGISTEGKILVQNGATLGGTGLYRPTNTSTGGTSTNIGLYVASGGAIAPGSGGIGKLSLSGQSFAMSSNNSVLTMASGSVFNFNLSGSGGTPDQLDFLFYTNSGTQNMLKLNNNLVNFSLVGAPVAGTYTVDLFRFYNDGGTTFTSSGISSGLVVGTLGSGISSGSFIYGPDRISFTYSAVPEPSTVLAASLLLGTFGWAAAARRLRRTRGKADA